MIKLKDNSKRAEQAKLFLKISMVLAVLAIMIHIYSMIFLNRINSGNFSFEEINTYTLIVSIIAIVVAVGIILCAIFFIMWFRRAYYNMHQIYKSGLRYSEGWAAGAWFVPIFWWFGPYQIAKDLFEKSENVLTKNNLFDASMKTNVFGIWWGFWIASNILSNVEDRIGDWSGVIIGLISSILSIIAAIYAIKTIEAYQKREKLLPQIGDGNVTVDRISDSQLLDDF